MKLLLAVLVSLLFQQVLCNFEHGEFIQAAIKSQFAEIRTNWKDLLGHYCPKFGEGDVVAVPLQRPADGVHTNEYKVQLSFDGDRFVTPWFPVIAPKDAHPYFRSSKGFVYSKLRVTLTRTGNELQGVHVELVDLHEGRHDTDSQASAAGWNDMDNWPKHLIVEYQWHAHNPIDLSRGLYVLYGMGLLVAAITIFTSLWGYRSKLLQFISEVTSEEQALDSTLVRPAGAKAD